STASACLRRLSLFVNSVRTSQAAAQSSIYSGLTSWLAPTVRRSSPKPLGSNIYSGLASTC
ncbi:MAG: hypothetical protein AAB324_03945, partial [candidate division NC10 bacterium]